MGKQGRAPSGRPVLVVVIFGSGTVVMQLELLASRLMAPYFGGSVLVWSNILASLSIGYWLGGRLADCVSNREVLA